MPHFNQILLPRMKKHPRILTPEQMAERIRGVSQVEPTICEFPEQAWSIARDRAGENDLICVTGSVFLAGAMRPMLTSGKATDQVR